KIQRVDARAGVELKGIGRRGWRRKVNRVIAGLAVEDQSRSGEADARGKIDGDRIVSAAGVDHELIEAATGEGEFGSSAEGWIVAIDLGESIWADAQVVIIVAALAGECSGIGRARRAADGAGGPVGHVIGVIGEDRAPQ